MEDKGLVMVVAEKVNVRSLMKSCTGWCVRVGDQSGYATESSQLQKRLRLQSLSCF